MSITHILYTLYTLYILYILAFLYFGYFLTLSVSSDGRKDQLNASFCFSWNTSFPKHCLHVAVLLSRLRVCEGVPTPRVSALTQNNEFRIGFLRRGFGASAPKLQRSALVYLQTIVENKNLKSIKIYFK